MPSRDLVLGKNTLTLKRNLSTKASSSSSTSLAKALIASAAPLGSSLDCSSKIFSFAALRSSCFDFDHSEYALFTKLLISSFLNTAMVHSSSSSESGIKFLAPFLPFPLLGRFSRWPVPPRDSGTQLASRGASRARSSTYLRLSAPKIPFTSIGPQIGTVGGVSFSASDSVIDPRLVGDMEARARVLLSAALAAATRSSDKGTVGTAREPIQ
mmetsp:Transcript_25394/g.39315  ORF Transcript_25394/g.39315 Transcript_25394/m.39315 type:complete len:212 (+) Transcript_25394:586-1221(+)